MADDLGEAPRKAEDGDHPGADAHPPAPPEVRIRVSEELAWFDELIGRVTQGYVYLLGGAPGSGKSKFSTQFGIDQARRGEKVLFLLTEESESRLRSRIVTMMSDRSREEIEATLSRIYVEDALTSIELLPQFVASQILPPTGRFHGARLLIIDSLMGHGLPATSARRWERIFDGLRLCRQAGLTTFGIAHVNKANAIGGPRTLTHNVDTVLVLRQLGNYRLMFSVKNRNGPTDLRRPARLVDPVSLSLQPAPMSEPLVVSARSYSAGLAKRKCRPPSA